jgi:hypothetical protein
MRSFIDGNGGSNSNVLIQEELGATVSPKRYAYKRPRNNGSEENLKARIYGFGAPTERESATDVKVEMSEEIQRLSSELDGMGTMLKGKEEQIRRSKRQSKLRIYLP